MVLALKVCISLCFFQALFMILEIGGRVEKSMKFCQRSVIFAIAPNHHDCPSQ
ncbi:MAG: hypothetical protein MUF49_25700 [Oculatellaceae cyanobacterium Prado106]|nr:hypothetical protein [Oculatellaceae cyanobacterium Prado106]